MGRRRRRKLEPRYNGVAIRVHGLMIYWRQDGSHHVVRRPTTHHEVHHAAYSTAAGQERLGKLWAIAAVWADDPEVRMEAATWM